MRTAAAPAKRRPTAGQNCAIQCSPASTGRYTHGAHPVVRWSDLVNGIGALDITRQAAGEFIWMIKRPPNRQTLSGGTEKAELSTEADGRSLAGFFGLAFGLTWLAWVPLAVVRRPKLTPARTMALVAGCFGPTAAALLLIAREPSSTRHLFWRRLVDSRPIRGRWGAAALVLLPGIQAVAIGAARLAGHGLPSLREPLQIVRHPVGLATFLMSELVTGPLAEELGWRGFALPRMQARFGSVQASSVLGMIWWAWHLPLFFIPGTAQAKMGLRSSEFGYFLARIVSESVLLGWLCANTDNSTLAAILAHWSSNASSTLVAGGIHKHPDRTTEQANTVLKIVAATLVGLASLRAAAVAQANAAPNQGRCTVTSQ